MRTRTTAILSLCWMGSILTGCGSGQVFYRPVRTLPAPSSPLYMLNDLAEGSTNPLTATRPATQPATQPATAKQPAIRVAYSAPSSAHRQLVLVGSALQAASVGELSGAGREAADAQLSGGLTPLSIASNAPGLGAPQPLTNNVVVGQDGLQPGIAIGFGPVPANNLFTRNIFPISGPGGACEALHRAGFPVNGNCPRH